MTTPTITPNVLWAQRKAEVYLTIEVSEANVTKKDFMAASSLIEGIRQGDDAHFKVGLDFYGEIVPEETKLTVTDRVIYIVCSKKDKEAPYWPRLTKTKASFVHTDFSRWIEEEDENQTPGGDAGNFNFDPSQFGNFNFNDEAGGIPQGESDESSSSGDEKEEH